MVNLMHTKHLFRRFLVLIIILAFFGSAGIIKNVSADTTDNDLNANLISAAFSGNLSEVERLLKIGANVNAKRKDGLTALMGASIEGHREMVELLVAKGASINEETTLFGKNSTACSLASRAGHQEIVELLIRLGANFRESEVTSPLMGGGTKTTSPLGDGPRW